MQLLRRTGVAGTRHYFCGCSRQDIQFLQQQMQKKHGAWQKGGKIRLDKKKEKIIV